MFVLAVIVVVLLVGGVLISGYHTEEERTPELRYKYVYGFDKKVIGVDIYLGEVPMKFIPVPN